MLENLRKQTESLELLYVGAHNGPEYTYAQEWGVPFESIPVGKWRRYWCWKNLTDPIKVAFGTLKSLWIVRRFKPDVVFSKGGFASVPVLLAARIFRVPIVIHDSDAVPGLTTRLTAGWAATICLGSASAQNYLPEKVHPKIMVTGIPIRLELARADAAKGRAITKFTAKKPIILIMGGSLGAANLNQAVKSALPQLSKTAQILHITGRGKSISKSTSNYRPYDYVGQELTHFYAMADLVVSRAGANSLAELETLGKPLILVPLGRDVSHGDQLVNAEVLRGRGGAVLIPDDELNGIRLMKEIEALMKSPTRLKEMGTLTKSDLHKNAAAIIAEILKKKRSR